MAGPSLIATLGANISGFVRDLDTARGQARTRGEGIGSAFSDAVGSKLSGIIGVAALEETIRRTVEYGSKINDLAIRLGISTDAVQQWDFALKQSGSSIDAAAGFFEKLAISRDKAMKGSDAQVAAFQKLGITLDMLKNSRVEDIAAVIAKGFESGDPQALIGPLREVGGKSAGALVTAFRDGLAEALTDAPLISPEDIAALDRAGDAWAKLKAEFTSSVAPLVATITEGALRLIDGARLMLAVPVGALMGVIEALKNASLADILSGKLFVDLARGGAAGMVEALDAVSQQQGQRDRDAEARQARLATRKTSTFEEDDSKQKEKDDRLKKSADEARRAAEKQVREEEAARKKAQLQGLNAEKDQAEAQVKLERGARPLSENSFGKFGAAMLGGPLSQAPEFAMLDVQRKSEQHLAAIKQSIARLNKPTSSADDVEF